MTPFSDPGGDTHEGLKMGSKSPKTGIFRCKNPVSGLQIAFFMFSDPKNGDRVILSCPEAPSVTTYSKSSFYALFKHFPKPEEQVFKDKRPTITAKRAQKQLKTT